MARRNAAIYARISLDTDGAGLGVARQIEDCVSKAQALGWAVQDTYADNDVSATKRKARPEYERMLADLESGRVDSVVVYDLDRLTRKPAELEAFIELADRLGVTLANVSGDVDLTTSSGRMTARIKGAVARQEAERLGERVKRQKEQRLAAGKPPGSRWRTFGYTHRTWRVVPSEAAIVRDVFERVAAGESLNSITNDLRDRRIKRVSGEEWSYQATLRMVRSPIYAGLLSYKGERAGVADIQPIITEELFEAADARREKRPGRTNVRRHLLSGIATCSKCHTPMTVTGRREGSSAAYVCNRRAGGCGNLSISRERLDEVVENAISTDLLFESLAGDSEPETEDDGLGDQIAALDERIVKTQVALTAGTLDYEDGLPMLADLRANRRAMAHIRGQRAKAEARFLGRLTDYETADLGRKVAEVRRRIAAIIVHPTKARGRNSFDASRFEVVLTGGKVVPGDVLVEGSMRFGEIPRRAGRD